MMRSTFAFLLAAALADCPGFVPAQESKKPKVLLDCAADPHLFDTRFVRFGPSQFSLKDLAKLIPREGQAIRFHLPPLKNAGQWGLYSYVVLAGDFEISANYTWAGIPVPQVGRGASCGIAVDTKGPEGTILLARATLPGKSAGYVIFHANSIRSTAKHIPTKAMFGRLAFRREKKDLICLAGDEKKDLVELTRLPFTEATVQEVRIYGDAGGTDIGLDARIYNFRVVAEEILGHDPELDKENSLGWWLYIVAAVASGAGWAAWRRWRASNPKKV